MLFYLDTEFTSLKAPKLISIGLVAESTPETSLYVELVDGYQLADCSDFVLAYVLPHLEQGSARMPRRQAAGRIARWIASFPGRHTLVNDHPWFDVELLSNLLGSAWPARLSRQSQVFDPNGVRDYEIATALHHARRGHDVRARLHHAGDDARRLKRSVAAVRHLGRDPFTLQEHREQAPAAAMTG
ncbi:hypothetical protein J2T57_003622 [Natronocella acetinitrilica]|uniref:Uncharacterized protein n=1 Tax=Natronocella acetinitrilica TaxID=414046 RepID=A0AAE3KD59_9GAMM|nr:hypothetical protein [Natronocella acetinitrilica]MCP1676461.1 hypothetical protein [Natronocella acetinitrilica]